MRNDHYTHEIASLIRCSSCDRNMEQRSPVARCINKDCAKSGKWQHGRDIAAAQQGMVNKFIAAKIRRAV